MADNPRIEELRRRVQMDPASIAFAQLAEEYRRAGCFDDAVQVCRAGLERHPTYLSARVTLGRALIELEQYDGARAELEQVLRSAPENLAAMRGLAEIHQRRGNLSDALRQYQTALAIARHDPELEELVHDLARQVGGARPSAPVAEPPLELLDLPEPAAAPAGPGGEMADEPEPSAASLSPELEAAADEFTKALLALDALAINLPEAQAEDEAGADASVASIAPPAAAALQESNADIGEQQQPELSGEAPPPDASPAPSQASREDPDAKIVEELETWLDAIFLDREERHAGGPEKQGEEDLPLNTP